MNKASGKNRAEIIKQQQDMLRSNLLNGGNIYSNGEEFRKLAEEFVVNLYGENCSPRLRLDAMKLFFGYDEETKNSFYGSTIRKMQDEMLDNKIRNLVLYAIEHLIIPKDIFLSKTYTTQEQKFQEIINRFNNIITFYKTYFKSLSCLSPLVYIPDVYGGRERLDLQMKYIGIPFNLEFITDNRIAIIGNNGKGIVSSRTGYCIVGIDGVEESLNYGLSDSPFATILIPSPASKREIIDLIKKIPVRAYKSVTSNENLCLKYDFGPKIQAASMQDNKINSREIFQFLENEYGIQQKDKTRDSSILFNLLQKYIHSKASEKSI